MPRLPPQHHHFSVSKVFAITEWGRSIRRCVAQVRMFWRNRIADCREADDCWLSFSEVGRLSSSVIAPSPRIFRCRQLALRVSMRNGDDHRDVATTAGIAPDDARWFELAKVIRSRAAQSHLLADVGRGREQARRRAPRTQLVSRKHVGPEGLTSRTCFKQWGRRYKLVAGAEDDESKVLERAEAQEATAPTIVPDPIGVEIGQARTQAFSCALKPGRRCTPSRTVRRGTTASMCVEDSSKVSTRHRLARTST